MKETVLDYTFVKLGITGDSIAHPIVLTEPVCNPNYNRKSKDRLFTALISVMSELLFETYNAPSVSYGIDALFSYRQNVTSPTSTGLVVSAGNHATHVIPVIQGRGILSQTKRLQWGGTQAVEFMLKLLQLKYPGFPSKLNFPQAQTLVWDHCYVAQDYPSELSRILDRTQLKELDRTIQFPYTEFVYFFNNFADIACCRQERRRHRPGTGKKEGIRSKVTRTSRQNAG